MLPYDQLDAGVRRALATAERLLEGADSLRHAKQEASALVLYAQALEQIGRATLLRKAKARWGEQVRVPGLNDRSERLLAAEEELGSHHFRIGGTDPWGAFDPNHRDVGRSLRLKIRLRTLITDFRSGRWFEPPSPDSSSLERRIRELRLELARRQSTWSR